MNYRSYLPVILSILFCTSGLSMTLEEAGKALSSDNQQMLLLAEKTIKDKGWESLQILNPMMFSGDKAIEAKARHLRRWIMFGLNNDIPEDTRNKLLSFNSLDLEEQEKLIRGLRKLDIAHPVTMACLHSRVLDLTIDAASILKLKKAVKDILLDSLRKRAVGIGAFDPLLLHPETRALIFNHLANNNIASLFEPYIQWLQLDPSMRIHLDRTAVKLDITRMVRTGRQREALTLLSSIIDPSALNHVKREVEAWVRKGTLFPLNELTLDESEGYLELIHSPNIKLTDASKPYQLLHHRHPSLPQKLRPQLRIHEVIRLLDEKKFYKAFDFSMRSLDHKNVQKVGLEELGEWAAKNQESLTKGLPDVQLEHHDKLYQFTSKLAPMNKLNTFAELEQSARIFNMLDLRTPKKGLWLSIARKHSPHLYIHTMALRNKLDDVVSYFEKQQSNSNQELVGILLGLKPEFAKQINVAKHTPKTLQTILTGVWDRGTNKHQKLLLGNELATTWETTHPDLLRKIEHRGLSPLLALRLWNKDEYGKAIKLLATDTRNSYFLAGMLNTVAEIDLHKHLSPIFIPTEFIERLIEGLITDIQEDSTVKPQQIKHALVLSTIYRDRPDSKLGGGLNSLYTARKVAYSMWLKGDTELAYKLIETVFWNATDNDKDLLFVFPELAVTLGKIDIAIAHARKLQHRDARYGIKLTYLLRSAGKITEAYTLSKKFPKSKIHLQLCLETHHLEAADKSIRHRGQSSEYTNTRRAWYAYLRGDLNLARSHFSSWGKENQWLTMLLENYADAFGFNAKYNREKTIKQMARDHSMISYCEQKLLTVVEAETRAPYRTMSIYFKYADYLSNKKLSVSLANRLGKLPFCDPGCGLAESWQPWAHKMMAIKALAKLGRPDLVKEHIRLAFAQVKDLSQITSDEHPRTLMQGIFHPMPWSPEALIKLASLELPEATLADRLIFLFDTFSAPDRITSVRKLLTMTRKHEKQFTREELTQLALFYSQALHQNTLEKKTLLKGEQSPLDSLELKLGNHPPIRCVSPSHLRPSGKVTILTKPGKNTDPKSKDFNILDGIHHVNILWNAQKKQAAKNNLANITLRILLDRGFNNKGFRIKQGNSTSSVSGSSPEGPLHLFTIMHMPQDLVETLDEVMKRIPSGGSDCYGNDNYQLSSELALQHGDYNAALEDYLLYLSTNIFRDPAVLAARFHDLKLISSVANDDEKKTLYHLRQRMQLDPYDTELIIIAVKKLQSKGKTKTIENIDSIITTFWENKLLRLPN